MKYLGIDYGKNKMGLAISEGLTSSPLKVLSISGLEDALFKIRKEIEREGVDLVVVGVAESGEARSVTEKFIKALKPYIDLVEVPETLSTQNALSKMIQLGKSKKARGREDAEAAALILQEYLDERG